MTCTAVELFTSATTTVPSMHLLLLSAIRATDPASQTAALQRADPAELSARSASGDLGEEDICPEAGTRRHQEAARRAAASQNQPGGRDVLSCSAMLSGCRRIATAAAMSRVGRQSRWCEARGTAPGTRWSILDTFAGSLSQQWVLTAGDVMTCRQLCLRRRLIFDSRGHVKSSVSPPVADQALLTLILSGF